MLPAFTILDDGQVAVASAVKVGDSHTAVAGSEDVIVLHSVEVDAVMSPISELLIEVRIPVRVVAKRL